MSRRTKSPKGKAPKKGKTPAKPHRNRSPLKSKKNRSRSRSRSPGAPRRPRKKGLSENKESKVHECWPVEIGEDVADMTTSRELTPSERNTLLQIAPLYVRWGYRTGPQSNHQGYELMTHGCCRMLQEYTDILFRNLQQTADGRRQIFDSDSIDKARDTPNLQRVSADMAEQSTRILEQYFQNAGTINTFLAFAEQDLFREPHSVGYVSMVIAARATICIWLRNYQTAKAHLDAFVRQFDALEEAEPRAREEDLGDFSGSEFDFG
jgi:hypothetical protein